MIRAAFQLALRRRKRVTLVDKANVLPSMAFFRQVFDEVAREFPGVETDRVYVDAAALYLVQRPEMFDVIVTENMFGDILSDLAAALVGGMGMAPSADIGERYAVFQPSHGSAPDIAGQGIANPVATILSAAMMLDWLDDARHAARGRHDSMKPCAPYSPTGRHRTRDMGGMLSTSQMSDAIIGALPRPADPKITDDTDIRIFDTHTHVGKARHSGRAYSADELLRDMDRFGVERSLAIPYPVVDDWRAEHDVIGRAVRAHPDRLCGSACLDPCVAEPVFREEVRRCREAVWLLRA